MHDLYAWLEDQNGGIRTYAEFHQKAQHMAREDAANAAILALLGRVAARFVARYEGEPLPVDNASAAFAEFKEVVAKAANLSSNSSSERLDFANMVATFDLAGVKAS